MLGKIIEQIKTGTISNVIPYGFKRPAPPYVVVKPESDSLGRGRVFVVHAHFSQTGQSFLEDYIFTEIINLLDDFEAESRHGNYNALEVLEDYQDIIVNNDDDTISMAQKFLMPSRTF